MFAAREILTPDEPADEVELTPTTPKSNARRFIQLAGAASALGLIAYSTGYERHNVQITNPTIRLHRLPPALDGLRIVQISDLHFGHYAEESYLRAVVAQINALAPDLVLLTGDFVSELTFGDCRRSARLSIPCAEILSGIQCPSRWAVLGNHDQLVGPEIVANALQSHGFPVLQNDYAAFEHRGARLWIAGVRSASESEPDLRAALPDPIRASGDPVILLVHEPDFADEVDLYGGVDLALSGHTHGGQVRLPPFGALKLPPGGRKYIQGLFQFPRGLQLYVNRGIGAMKLPIRFLCRPEITLITLRSA